MLMREPGQTNYDLSFSVLGFPVRVHPAFFILPVIFARNLVGDGLNLGVGMLLVAGVFFVSILVHELGHALAFKLYGIPSRIVLYWLGGLAIPESSSGWSAQRSSLSPNQRIVVSFAGPAFGLLLALLTVGVVFALGGTVVISRGLIPMPLPSLQGSLLEGNLTMQWLLFVMIVINIFLNLLNLLPIFPLDGGQIARQIFTQLGSDGIRNSLYLSIACSGLIAFYFLSTSAQFNALFFGYMAYTNFMMLQEYNGSRW